MSEIDEFLEKIKELYLVIYERVPTSVINRIEAQIQNLEYSGILSQEQTTWFFLAYWSRNLLNRAINKLVELGIERDNVIRTLSVWASKSPLEDLG